MIRRVDQAAAAEGLKKKIETVQKDLAASQDKEKNLALVITNYEAKAPKTEDNQEVTDQFIKRSWGR